MKAAILIVTAGILAVPGLISAEAAELPLPPPIPVKVRPSPPVPYYNWTGFYIGANGGYGWGHQSYSGASVTPFGPATFGGTGNSSGWLAGGQIGFNYEFPTMNVVIGVEADGDWSNIKGSSSSCAALAGGVPAGCAVNSTALNDIGTVRGRLGYAWNNVLLYGTGGWAWGTTSGTSTTTCVGPGCPGASIPFTGGTATYGNTLLNGWTAGGGIEYGFLPNLTARVEYLHVWFDNVGTNYTSTTSVGTTTTHIASNNGIDMVRIGINYLFNFGALPLTAGY
jgi:outer membrane immunogenic protein